MGSRLSLNDDDNPTNPIDPGVRFRHRYLVEPRTDGEPRIRDLSALVTDEIALVVAYADWFVRSTGGGGGQRRPRSHHSGSADDEASGGSSLDALSDLPGESRYDSGDGNDEEGAARPSALPWLPHRLRSLLMPRRLQRSGFWHRVVRQDHALGGRVVALLVRSLSSDCHALWILERDDRHNPAAPPLLVPPPDADDEPTVVGRLFPALSQAAETIRAFAYDVLPPGHVGRTLLDACVADPDGVLYRVPSIAAVLADLSAPPTEEVRRAGQLITHVDTWMRWMREVPPGPCRTHATRARDDRTCFVCLRATHRTVCLPCGHCGSCEPCLVHSLMHAGDHGEVRCPCCREDFRSEDVVRRWLHWPVAADGKHARPPMLLYGSAAFPRARLMRRASRRVRRDAQRNEDLRRREQIAEDAEVARRLATRLPVY